MIDENVMVVETSEASCSMNQRLDVGRIDVVHQAIKV